MSTTAVFVELLSAGALALIAILLALIGLGVSPESFIDLLGDGRVATAVSALVVAYPLGIMVDAVADRLFRNVGSKYEACYGLARHQSVFALASSEYWSDFAAKYFEYNRVRTRIVRSFLFNSFLMVGAGISAGAALSLPPQWLVCWSLLWLLLAALAWWTLRELRNS